MTRLDDAKVEMPVMMRAAWSVLLLVAAVSLSSCGSTALTSTTLPTAPTRVPATSATTTSAAGALQATSTTSSTIPEDPWEIEVVPVAGNSGAVLEVGIEDILSGVALIEATIVSIGDPETGRWCCGNPPFQVEKIEILGGEFRDDTNGWLNGTQYQSLDRTLNPGDRVTILLRDNSQAAFVFTRDEGLAHPAPAHQAEAIGAMRTREALSAGGWEPIDYSPRRAVTDIWHRYHNDWWGSMGQRVALAVSGVPEYPVVCSAADLAPVLNETPYAPASDGLPIAVSRTRDEVVAATATCDYENILALAGSVDGEDAEEFWWSAGSSLEAFMEADRRYGAMRELALALLTTAVARETVAVESDSGSSIDQTFYVWPSASVILNDPDVDRGASASSLLGAEEAFRVAALSATTVEDLDDATDILGGYAWFRTAIDATGRWRFALSGD